MGIDEGILLYKLEQLQQINLGKGLLNMKDTKDNIVTEMYNAGLLTENDTARYLSDESVDVNEMNKIKAMVQLCKNNQQDIQDGKVYPIEELYTKLRKICEN